jgi:hypothetical protein
MLLKQIFMQSKYLKKLIIILIFFCLNEYIFFQQKLWLHLLKRIFTLLGLLVKAFKAWSKGLLLLEILSSKDLLCHHQCKPIEKLKLAARYSWMNINERHLTVDSKRRMSVAWSFDEFSRKWSNICIQQSLWYSRYKKVEVEHYFL